MSGAIPVSQFYPEYINALPLKRINQYCRRCPEHLDKLCDLEGSGALARFEDCDILQEMF